MSLKIQFLFQSTAHNTQGSKLSLYLVIALSWMPLLLKIYTSCLKSDFIFYYYPEMIFFVIHELHCYVIHISKSFVEQKSLNLLDHI